MAAIVIGVMVSGCEYSETASNPIARNLSWFDYVGGRGLKEACGPGASNRFRFVYNGNYEEQIRTYDVHAPPNDRGAVVSVWVRGNGNLGQGIKFPNLLSPWDGDRIDTHIDQRAFVDLRNALKIDGFDGDRPTGLQMRADDYYWVVTGCLGGRFYSNAWLYLSERFKALTFPEKLRAGDKTGIKLRDAATAKIYEDYPTRHRGGGRVSHYSFIIELDADGIVGDRYLF